MSFEKLNLVVLKYVWWLVVLFATLLLLAHSFKSSRVEVDNTSLILLALILLSPFGVAVKKIKFGPLEAEIDPKEINKVAAVTEELLSKTTPRPEIASPRHRAEDEIRKLAETDPVIALAKLRIELESRLRNLLQGSGNAPPPQVRTLIRLVRDLQAAHILTPQLGMAILEVTSICNRAIHGEEIRDIDARRIIDAGTSILEELDVITSSLISKPPRSIEVIDRVDVERSLAARYRLTTVIPYVDKPERRIYELNQIELDAFFDNYSEFAEFVTGIEAL